jgi:hypothetical protein
MNYISHEGRAQQLSWQVQKLRQFRVTVNARIPPKQDMNSASSDVVGGGFASD